jgi:hypothetical protein
MIRVLLIQFDWMIIVKGLMERFEIFNGFVLVKLVSLLLFLLPHQLSLLLPTQFWRTRFSCDLRFSHSKNYYNQQLNIKNQVFYFWLKYWELSNSHLEKLEDISLNKIIFFSSSYENFNLNKKLSLVFNINLCIALS